MLEPMVSFLKMSQLATSAPNTHSAEKSVIQKACGDDCRTVTNQPKKLNGFQETTIHSDAAVSMTTGTLIANPGSEIAVPRMVLSWPKNMNQIMRNVYTAVRKETMRRTVTGNHEDPYGETSMEVSI